ncbi:MAG: hypothetical protein N3F66_06260 [Spirochaetes bacterium]|nr:hypothetical protein [Spirochaetota bacterium]
MRKLAITVLLLLYANVIFAQDIVFGNVNFNSNNLNVYFSITDVKTNDIIEALKRGLEGQVEYTIQVVEDPLLPLMPKDVVKTITIKKRVKFDFFNKSYIVSQAKVPTIIYSDESLIDELFLNRLIVVEDGYRFRKSNYVIRLRVTFTSVKLYFPLNIIFNYIVGIWDFDTGWQYGPKLIGIPYSE